MRPTTALTIQSEPKPPPTLHRSEEASLLVLAKQGDTGALRRLYETYQPRVTRLCYRLLPCKTDVEDAVQATFVKVFRGLPQFRGESSLKTWVLRIAYNEAMNILRLPYHYEAEIPETFASIDSVTTPTDQIAVQQALAKLSAEYRAILTLFYWEELDYREIASVLNLSLPAVKMRMLRARHAFRRHFEEE